MARQKKEKKGGYSLETIQKFISFIRKWVEYFMGVSLDTISTCISEGNDKIGHVLNVSLPAILSCANCSECMHFCYDIRDCFRHGWDSIVMMLRAKNWAILLRDREKYFREIENAIINRTSEFFFRWHVGGDMPDADYFRRMVELAFKYILFVFWTYTKHYEIVNNYVRDHATVYIPDEARKSCIPSNFHIMFSDWDGMPMDNPYGFPIFACKMKKGNKNHPVGFFLKLWRCPGNCDICKKCKRGCVVGESSYTDQH